MGFLPPKSPSPVELRPPPHTTTTADTTDMSIAIDIIGITTDITAITDTSPKSPLPALSSPPPTTTIEDTTATTGITDTIDITIGTTTDTEDTELLAMCNSFCRTSESCPSTRIASMAT